MRKSLAALCLGLLLLGVSVSAQEATRPPALDQVEQTLTRLAPTEAQTQALMSLFLQELPRLMDPNADPASLARGITPEAERLLDADQREMLRALASDSGALRLGSMTREQRRRLIQDGLERLSHPDTQEWLRRIDSFDL